MPRVALDLNKAEDRSKVSGGWRVADGLVPGEPNEGLVSQILASPARLGDFDDSGRVARLASPSAGGASTSDYLKGSTVSISLVPASSSRPTLTITARCGWMARLTGPPELLWASTPSIGLK